jgi:hypothetical protein
VDLVGIHAIVVSGLSRRLSTGQDELGTLDIAGTAHNFGLILFVKRDGHMKRQYQFCHAYDECHVFPFISEPLLPREKSFVPDKSRP